MAHKRLSAKRFPYVLAVGHYLCYYLVFPFVSYIKISLFLIDTWMKYKFVESSVKHFSSVASRLKNNCVWYCCGKNHNIASFPRRSIASTCQTSVCGAFFKGHFSYLPSENLVFVPFSWFRCSLFVHATCDAASFQRTIEIYPITIAVEQVVCPVLEVGSIHRFFKQSSAFLFKIVKELLLKNTCEISLLTSRHDNYLFLFSISSACT